MEDKDLNFVLDLIYNKNNWNRFKTNSLQSITFVNKNEEGFIYGHSTIIDMLSIFLEDGYLGIDIGTPDGYRITGKGTRLKNNKNWYPMSKEKSTVSKFDNGVRVLAGVESLAVLGLLIFQIIASNTNTALSNENKKQKIVIEKLSERIEQYSQR